MNASAPRHFSTCTRQEFGSCCWCRPSAAGRGEHVHATADLDLLAVDFDQLKFRTRLVGFHDAGVHQRRDIGSTDHGAAVVVHLDEIAMSDASHGGVSRIEPQQPEPMPSDQRAMIVDAVHRGMLAVTMGMKAVAAVGGDQLQRIVTSQVRAQTLPGGIYRLSAGRSGLSAVCRFNNSGTNSSLPLGVCRPLPNVSENCDGSGWGSGRSFRLPSAYQRMSTG